jgi:hypothetical protein
MDGPPAEEGIHQIEELSRAIDDLRRRVNALEQQSVIALPHSLGFRSEAPPQLQSPEVPSGLVAQFGRLLLGIAGAYLLRAITEAGIVPELTGVIVGLIYAGAWLIASLRTPGINRVALVLEGLTASAIATPLLWEATTRLHVISPSGAASALAIFIVLGQIVAWKHDHSALAAITALAGSITAIALMIATLDPVPFVTALLVAAAITEYGAIREHALSWRWIIALAADFCAFLLVYLVSRAQGLPEGYAKIPATAVFTIPLTLVAVYLASTAIRTLGRGLQISLFEILQSAAVVTFVIVSNLRVPHALGCAIIAAAVTCYLVSFSRTTRRRTRNFHVYATFGAALLLVGSFLLLPTSITVFLWSILALSAIWFGQREKVITLRVHGVAYLLAASALSFKLGFAWPPAIAALLAYSLILGIKPVKTQPLLQRIPAAIIVALLVWAAYTVFGTALIAAHLGASVIPALRTILLSLIAIALGWFGRRSNRVELVWVLYPWMTYGAVKLIAEDFQHGRSLTLFFSLLVYGGTLILLPRLLRRTPARLD